MLENIINIPKLEQLRISEASQFSDSIKEHKAPFPLALINLIIKNLSAKYDISMNLLSETTVDSKLLLVLFHLSKALLDHDIRGKKVLDLGCGSTGDTYEAHFMNEKRQFEPWISRALLDLGAHVTGIDVGKLDNERFEYLRVDLAKENSLAFIKNETYHAVLALNFYDSPELTERTSYFSWRDQITGVKKILRPQIVRVLKSNGVYLEDRKIYIKKDNQLFPI